MEAPGGVGLRVGSDFGVELSTRWPYYTERQFWTWVVERWAIYERRQRGEPPPWTLDPVMQRYHFCNVRRAWDRGTIWYQQRVAPKARSFRHLLWLTINYRLINNVALFERFGLPPMTGWRSYLKRWEAEGAKPHSQAYYVLTGIRYGGTRLEKWGYFLRQLEAVLPPLADIIASAKTLREVSEALQRLEGIGAFLALQIYRDLLLVGALRFSEDDWVEVGPGAAEALRHMYGRGDYRQMVYALHAQQDRLSDMGLPQLPQRLPVGDVENCLCEYNKWVKLSQGKGRRRYYHGAH